jgi:hypothetical protein
MLDKPDACGFSRGEYRREILHNFLIGISPPIRHSLRSSHPPLRNYEFLPHFPRA